MSNLPANHPDLRHFDEPAPLVRLGQGDYAHDIYPSDWGGGDARSTKSVLTFSALNTFRNCPRKYKHRFVDHLQPREKPENLSFGSIIHGALERWYRLAGDENRLWKVLDFIDAQFPQRGSDPVQKDRWHRARAMLVGYAARYPTEDFEIVEVEKVFHGEIRNPDNSRLSQTFVMAGKADGIVRLEGELYLLEHKTAGSIGANYLDKLWTDTQIALYSYYLRQVGYRIVGVIYNVLLKTRIKQREGETQEWPALHAAIRAARKAYQTDGEIPDWESVEALSEVVRTAE